VAATTDGSELSELATALFYADEESLPDLVGSLPPATIAALLGALGPEVEGRAVPHTPLEQAQALDPGMAERPHLIYLADRLARALRDVEHGRSRQLLISMPPRSGKSTLTSHYLPVWLLSRHPEWSVGLISHDGDFSTSWGRRIRTTIENSQLTLGINLDPSIAAAGEWETTAGGGVLARGIGGSITGRGFKVLIMDDVVKGVVDAHSPRIREMVWDRWRSDIYTRLEPPYLLVVIGTRWHEDDFIGRLLSPDYDGDPADWEVISFPAIAEEADTLGRSPGEPLLSPLLNETPEQAQIRWSDARTKVGSYTWAALYQQRPSPAKGAIFDTGWWRFWTNDPSKVQRSDQLSPGRVILLPDLSGARWLDSWDAAFKGTDSSDWVVGQRWCRLGPKRFLIAQIRGRFSFTETLARMLEWSDPYLLPTNRLVHQRLIEDKANGPAIIDTLSSKISGLKPVNPMTSKEARARAITPEIESGHVYLPHPGDPGNEWVEDLLSELRNFPNDIHDDQVDALDQALAELRESTGGALTVPGNHTPSGMRQLSPSAAAAAAANYRTGGELIKAAQSDLRRAGRVGVQGWTR